MISSPVAPVSAFPCLVAGSARTVEFDKVPDLDLLGVSYFVEYDILKHWITPSPGRARDRTIRSRVRGVRLSEEALLAPSVDAAGFNRCLRTDKSVENASLGSLDSDGGHPRACVRIA